MRSVMWAAKATFILFAVSAAALAAIMTAAHFGAVGVVALSVLLVFGILCLVAPDQ